jgi:NADPH2:quinone reductase
MKAVLVKGFGDPDVLQVAEVPDPQAGPGQVRVAVHAAGTNPVDAGNRADGTWARLRPPCILGYDIAGVVDQVGDGVHNLRVGDRVMAMTPFPSGAGGYAELTVLDADLTVLDADLVAPIPADCSFIDAAAVPLAAGTAWEVLRRLQPVPGAWVLVHGASGGVGTFFVQLAAAGAVRVIAVGGAGSHHLLGELGAACCVDYHATAVAPAAVAAAGGPVDAIVDLVGGAGLQASLTAVRAHGHLAAIATPHLDLDPVLDANLTFHGVLIEDNDKRTRNLADLLGRHTIRPVIAGVYPLERAAEAHRRLETGHSGGKIVLQVRDG